MVTTLDGGITVANRIGNPYPEGLVKPLGSKPGLLAQLGLALQPWSNHLTGPHTQHYNFGLQRELPGGMLVDIAWVGSHSVGLPIAIPENQLQPQYLSLGSQLLTQVKNPFFGFITTGALSQPTIAQNLLLRPFPQFSDISFYSPIAQATYNSMQLRMERRFKNDFGFLVSYTFSKALTNTRNTGIFGFQTPQIQNLYNLTGEKAISPIDVTHRIVVSQTPPAKRVACWVGPPQRRLAIGLGVALKRALDNDSELPACSIRVVLFADVLADLLQFKPDRGDGVAAGPEMLTRKIPLLATQPGNGDSALPFQEPDHRSHRVLGGNRNAHVHMVRHEVPFDSLHSFCLARAWKICPN